MRKVPGCCAQEAAHSMCAQIFGGEVQNSSHMWGKGSSSSWWIHRGCCGDFQPIPQAGMAPFPTDGGARRGASVPSPLCVQITSPVAHCPLIHCSERALSRPHALFQAKISAESQNLCHQSLGDTISHPCGGRQRGPTKPSINFLMWEAKKREYFYINTYVNRSSSRGVWLLLGHRKAQAAFLPSVPKSNQGRTMCIPFLLQHTGWNSWPKKGYQVEFLGKNWYKVGLYITEFSQPSLTEGALQKPGTAWHHGSPPRRAH